MKWILTFLNCYFYNKLTYLIRQREFVKTEWKLLVKYTMFRLKYMFIKQELFNLMVN